MNTHLDDGQLRAALDGEAGPAALYHLQSCPSCQARQEAMKAQADGIAQRLAFLSGAGSESAPPVRSSLKRLYAKERPQKEIFMLRKFFASTTVRVAALAVLLLAVILSVPSARAFAGEILNLFRVQQVTVVSIDTSGLQQLTGNQALGKQISQLVSSSVTVTQKPGDPEKVADAAEATQKAGFDVRLPQTQTASALYVHGASGFDFTVDRAKAQALLDEAGRSDLVLPQEVDGAVVSVKIPAAVMADYGACPDPAQADSNQNGSMSRQFPDCVIFSQMPSPTVNAPASVDVAQLAQIGLEFTGMSSDQAAAFTKSVDWTSTLVIPVPKNAATNEQVSVDGVTGTLIQRPSDDAPQYLLIWVKDGIVYSIVGLGSDSQQALDMANSLK